MGVTINFYATIAAILCIQHNLKDSLNAALTREIATVIGGIFGMVILSFEKNIYRILHRRKVLPSKHIRRISQITLRTIPRYDMRSDNHTHQWGACRRPVISAREKEGNHLQSLSSVLTSTVQDTKNRLARMDFKIAVELSMLAHMIAYHSESRIDESAFRKLHAKCVEEVRRLNGAVELGDAYKYQKREN